MISLRFDFQFLAIAQLSNKVRRKAEFVGCFDPLFWKIQLKANMIFKEERLFINYVVKNRSLVLRQYSSGAAGEEFVMNGFISRSIWIK